jgi:hypothetical protein
MQVRPDRREVLVRARSDHLRAAGATDLPPGTIPAMECRAQSRLGRRPGWAAGVHRRPARGTSKVTARTTRGPSLRHSHDDPPSCCLDTRHGEILAASPSQGVDRLPVRGRGLVPGGAQSCLGADSHILAPRRRRYRRRKRRQGHRVQPVGPGGRRSRLSLIPG